MVLNLFTEGEIQGRWLVFLSLADEIYNMIIPEFAKFFSVENVGFLSAVVAEITVIFIIFYMF